MDQLKLYTVKYEKSTFKTFSTDAIRAYKEFSNYYQQMYHQKTPVVTEIIAEEIR